MDLLGDLPMFYIPLLLHNGLLPTWHQTLLEYHSCYAQTIYIYIYLYVCVRVCMYVWESVAVDEEDPPFCIFVFLYGLNN